MLKNVLVYRSDATGIAITDAGAATASVSAVEIATAAAAAAADYGAAIRPRTKANRRAVQVRF